MPVELPGLWRQRAIDQRTDAHQVERRQRARQAIARQSHHRHPHRLALRVHPPAGAHGAVLEVPRILDHQQQPRAALAGLARLGRDGRARREVAAVEAAVLVAFLRLVREHQHRGAAHIDAGVVVVAEARGRDAVAGEHHRHVAHADRRRQAIADRQRVVVAPERERLRAGRGAEHHRRGGGRFDADLGIEALEEAAVGAAAAQAGVAKHGGDVVGGVLEPGGAVAASAHLVGGEQLDVGEEG